MAFHTWLLCKLDGSEHGRHGTGLVKTVAFGFGLQLNRCLLDGEEVAPSIMRIPLLCYIGRVAKSWNQAFNIVNLCSRGNLVVLFLKRTQFGFPV
jgi:hypothetical protein